MLRGRDMQEFMEMKREGLSTQAISQLTGVRPQGHLQVPCGHRKLRPAMARELRRRANWTRTRCTWKTG